MENLYPQSTYLPTYSESDEKVLPFLFPQVASIKKEGPVEKGEQIYYKQREHEPWLGMKHNEAKISWDLIKYNRKIATARNF